MLCCIFSMILCTIFHSCITDLLLPLQQALLLCATCIRGLLLLDLKQLKTVFTLINLPVLFLHMSAGGDGMES